MSTEPLRIDARSASITVAAQVAVRGVWLLAVLASTAIVVRSVGIETYADWATVLTLTALVAFALDPGISPIVVRRLAQDPASAPLPAALVPLRLGLASVALLVVVSVSVGLRGSGTALLATLLGAQVLPRALALNATPWLQVDHRLHRQTILEAITATLGVLLLGAAALADAPAWVLGLVGFTAPTTLLALLMRRELAITPSRARDVTGPQRDRVRSLVREVAPLALALLLVATYTRTFVFFLNRTADSGEVARFLFAFQVIEQMIVVAGIVAGALLPLLAVRAVGRGIRRLQDAHAHDLLRVVTAIGTLATAAILLFSGPFTRLVGGPELEDAALDLRRLAPAGAVFFPAFVLAYMYVTAQMSSRYLRFNAVALAANILANFLLTERYGAAASARISWAGESLVLALALAPLLRGSPVAAGTAVRIGASIAISALISELVVAGTLAPALGALVLAIFVLVSFGGLLRMTARSVVRGAPVAEGDA